MILNDIKNNSFEPDSVNLMGHLLVLIFSNLLESNSALQTSAYLLFNAFLMMSLLMC